MKKTVTFIVACLIAAGASYAAADKSQAPAKPVASTQAPATTFASAADSGYDYRLERDSCCTGE